MLPHQQATGFTFKQFHIAHDRCGMKVGTDAILLGTWAPVDGIKRILDIGCGSGVLSLMLAQRCQGEAHIDALDIDCGAIEQTEQNVYHSPWPKSVVAHHVDLKNYREQGYDLLISNPPYFEHGQTFQLKSRQQARHTITLSHQQLLADTERLSHSQSLLALVVPVDVGELISQISAEYGWYVSRYCQVFSTPKKPAIRQLLLMGRNRSVVVEKTQLVIHQSDGRYSSEFVNLCRDFYLKM